MKLPSFGKLDLAQKCQFPWTSGLKHPKFDPTRAMYGKAVGSVAECIAIWGDAPIGDISETFKLDQENKDKLIAAYVELSELLEDDGHKQRHCEFAFGFQLHTGRTRMLDMRDRGAIGKKNWRRRKDEIIGVIDLLYDDGDKKLRVRDYKTGRYRMFTPPLEDLQLMGYGLAMSRMMDRDEVTVEFYQVGDDDPVRSGEMDEFMLDWTWQKIHKIAADCQDIKNNVPKPGPWCRDDFCPVVAQCPATQKAMVAIDTAAKVRLPMLPEIESDDHARHLLERLPAVKAAVAILEKALRDRHESNFLELPDGKVFGGFQESREPVIINEESIEIMTRILGDEAEALVESKVSKSALTALAKEKAPPKGGAALMRHLMSELREEGFVRETTITKFRIGKRPR